MKATRVLTISILALVLMVCWTATSLGKKPVTNEFTYQGRLSKQGQPATGLYDFRGILFDDPCEVADANRIGPVLEVNDVDVHGGRFQLKLDFGNDPNVFSGDKRWLVIEVRRSAANDANDVNDVYDVNDYTVLEPRIELTAAPYASTAVRISGKQVVKNEHLEDRAVGRDKIKDRAIGREKIDDRAVDPNKIDHKAVRREHLADKAVGREKIEDRAVDPNKIDHKAVKKEHIADKAVGREKIEDRAVDPNKIDHKAVKKEHLADKAVGREKIEDRAVGREKLEDMAVNSNKLADDSVTGIKIADGSVEFSDIARNGAQQGQVMKWSSGVWIAADDLTSASSWITSANHIYSPPLYKVGIGTASPQAKLTVAGAILREGSTMYGTHTEDHINLGMNSYTGMVAQTEPAYPTVSGGDNNRADGKGATVGGGFSNVASNDHATIGGGVGNRANGNVSAIGGGEGNKTSGNASAIGGGEGSDAGGPYATIGGGYYNTASLYGATIGGGISNTASNSGATVGGGQGNTTSGQRASIGGGVNNTADGNGATIAGGQGNTASGHQATIAGGLSNSATGVNATIGGGSGNSAGGRFATVPGGSQNIADADFSFAAGRQARVVHEGTFVWADSDSGDFTSTSEKQFLIRASGGVGIGTNNPQGQLDVNGRIYQRGSVLHADYVFEEGYELESIDEHSEFMWEQKHLPAVPKARSDENGQEIVEVGRHRKGILEELEKAHIYIEQLHNRLKTLEAKEAEIAARLSEMQSLMSKLTSQQEGGAE